jgi:hypothetical protein
MDVTRSGRRAADRLKGVLGALAACALVAGCSVAAASASPGASDNLLTSSPTATPTLQADAPTHFAGQVPSAKWSGLHWVQGAPLGSAATGQVTLAGWSGGYFTFTIGLYPYTGDPNALMPPTSITSSRSSDGINWLAGPSFQAAPEVNMITVVEGSAGLLLVAWLGACGAPAELKDIWQSRDGINWSDDLSAVFTGTTILQLSGGSVGYIASGFSGTEDAHSKPAVWTSPDGLHWMRSNLSGPEFSDSAIQDSAAFAGGYVLVGATFGPTQTCPYLVSASAWWSANGMAWSKDQLPEAASGGSIYMDLSRISDRELLLTELQVTTGSQASTTRAWTSVDGISWTPADPLLGRQAVANLVIATDGQWGVAVETGPDGIAAVDVIEGGSVRALPQTGIAPTGVSGESYQYALGPSGLLVASYSGDRSWLGVPTAP